MIDARGILTGVASHRHHAPHGETAGPGGGPWHEV